MPHRLSAFAALLRRQFTLVGGKGEPAAFPDFADMALELFRLQFETCAAYRRLCQSDGVAPGEVLDWRRIPAVPTAAFQELELTSIPPLEREYVFHSSGTTGQRPSRHFHHRESRSLYEASLGNWFAAHLLGGVPSVVAENRPCFVSLTPAPALAPHSSLVHMIAVASERFGPGDSMFAGQRDPEGAWVVDFERARSALEESGVTGRPVLILGTAFNLVHLAEHLGDRPLARLPAPGSRIMETGGYKGRSRELRKDELHAALSRCLGLEADAIVSEYGMSELGSQAYDRCWGAAAGARRFRFPPWVRVLAISPETGRPMGDGEVGLLRVFDPANVWSVMAVQTGDLGRVCGDGFELIGRAKAVEPRGCSLMAA